MTDEALTKLWDDYEHFFTGSSCWYIRSHRGLSPLDATRKLLWAAFLVIKCGGAWKQVSPCGFSSYMMLA